MSLRRLSSLFVLALGLGACAEVQTPGDEPSPEAGVEPRPTTTSQAKPRLCRLETDSLGPWQAAEGPRESLPHRLAATPGRLFVSSPHALRRSTDGGQTFEVIASPATSGYPGPIAGVDDVLFMATDTGAIRSEDGGETWLAANDGLDGGVVTFHRGKSSLLARSTVGSLVRWSASDAAWEAVDSGSSYSPGVAASDGKTVLVDTGAGVLRSTDLAAWSLVNGLEAWGYEDLMIADQRGLAITAGGEIRRSSDAGVNWLPAQQSINEIGVATRVLQHGDAMFALTDKGVVRSADGGASWGITFSDPSAGAATDLVEAGDLLAVELGTISVTHDGGATWSDAATFADSTPIAFGRVGSWLLTSTAAAGVFVSSSDEPFQATNASGYFLRDVEVGDDATYLLFSQQASIGGWGVSWATHTRDGGESFEAVALPSTGGVLGRSFETIAVDGELLFAGGIDAGTADGPGVWVSDDGGASWFEASDGLPKSTTSDELYPAVIALTKRGDSTLALLAGAGVFETRDGGASWERFGIALPDMYASPQEVLVVGDAVYLWSRGGSSILRSGGAGWETVTGSKGITALTSVGSTLVAAFEGGGVGLSNDGGQSFEPLSFDERVRALHVDGDALLAGVEGQGVFSTDVSACR